MDGEAFCPSRRPLQSWHLLPNAPPPSTWKEPGVQPFTGGPGSRLFLFSAAPVISHFTLGGKGVSFPTCGRGASGVRLWLPLGGRPDCVRQGVCTWFAPQPQSTVLALPCHCGGPAKQLLEKESLLTAFQTPPPFPIHSPHGFLKTTQCHLL